MSLLWQQCKAKLEEELTPQQFNTWVRPLLAVAIAQDALEIRSPNKFVLDWVRERYWTRIVELLDEFSGKTVTAAMVVCESRKLATRAVRLWPIQLGFFCAFACLRVLGLVSRQHAELMRLRVPARMLRRVPHGSQA